MNWFIPVIFLYLINFGSSDNWSERCIHSQSECRPSLVSTCCNPADKCLHDENINKYVCMHSDLNHDCPDDFYYNPEVQDCTIYAQDIGQYCINDDSCVHVKRSKCLNGTCQCSNTTKYTNGNCVEQIGSYCEETKNCNVPNSNCVNGQCVCTEGHYSSNDKFQCLALAKKLHDPCENYLGCGNLVNSHCNGTNCECYYNAREKNGTCFPLVHGYCNETLPCQDENSICKDGLCQCPDLDNYLIDLNRFACYKFAKRVGDSCPYHKVCNAYVPYTICLEGKCVCAPGYIKYGVRCIGTNGSKCEYTSQCETGFECQNKVCTCPNHAVFSADGKNCSQNYLGLGLSCSNNDKCVAPNSYCDDSHKCSCKRHYYAKNGTCIIDSKYECPKDYYFNSRRQKCTRYSRGINKYCYDEEACDRIKGSECMDKTCQCPGRTKYFNGTCLLPIGSYCQGSEQCNVPNSACIYDRDEDNHRCQCIEEHYVSNNNLQCLPRPIKLHDACDQKGCSELRNLHCNGTNCVCQENALEVNGVCLPLIDGNCSEKSPCQPAGSICGDGKCRCRDPVRYYPTDDKLACHKKAEELGDSCSSKSACRKFGDYSNCLDGKCVCESGYRLFDGEIESDKYNWQCYGTNGSSCRWDWNCGFNFECRGKVCVCPENAKLSDDGQNCNILDEISCPENHYFDRSKDKCSRFAQAIGDYCGSSDNCNKLKIAYTMCESSTCQCAYDYRYYNGTCVPTIGRTCSNNPQFISCPVANSECSKRNCQCIKDYYSSANETVCLPYTKELHNPCIDDEACEIIPFAVCSKDKKCQCKSNYIEKDGKCLGIIDEECWEDSDCSVENSYCSSNKCMCIQRRYDNWYDPSEDKRSCIPTHDTLTLEAFNLEMIKKFGRKPL